MAMRPHPPIACARPCPYFATHPHKSTLRSNDNGRRPSQQLQGSQSAQGRQPELHLFQPQGGRKGGRRPLAPALFTARPVGEPGAPRGRQHGQEDRYRSLCRLAEERRQVGQGDQFPPRARADAGLYRRAGGGRPRGHARRHGRAGRRRQEDQPAGAGRSRHRPFGDRRQFRQCRRLQGQRRARVRAQPRALPVPALGPDGVRQFPCRAAGYRHLPPGQPGIPGAGRVDQEGRQGDNRLSRHAGRHRQPHHDGERPLGAGLGRGRHRGRGRHARPADADGDSRRRGLQAQRQAARGRHRDRPGAHRHGHAAQEGRGQQVRRVLRRRSGGNAAGQPRHHREHGAGIWRNLRLLPGRRNHAGIPQDHQSRPGRQARGGLCQEAGPVALQEVAGADLHRHASPRPQ